MTKPLCGGGIHGRTLITTLLLGALGLFAPPATGQVVELEEGACEGFEYLPAVFMEGNSTLPPATMAPGETALVTLVFANCSGETWTHGTGYRLRSKPAYSSDLTQWGFSSVVLPDLSCFDPPCDQAVVPPDYSVAFMFNVTAPMIPADDYEFSWGIYQGASETPGFLVGTAAVATVDVVKAGEADYEQLCTIPSGGEPPPEIITVDITGNESAVTALQTCIDHSDDNGDLVELPVGIYLIDERINIDHPLTIRTVGMEESPDGCISPAETVVPCAVLQADPLIFDSENPLTYVPQGFFRILYTDHVTVDHLILDGNREVRKILEHNAYEQCSHIGLTDYWNRWGFNAAITNCADCTLNHFVSVNALCGTGLEWDNSYYLDPPYNQVPNVVNATITNSYFKNNGENHIGSTQGLWSDGLTLGQMDGSTIEDNYFANNTDVNLISGGGMGTAATLSGNTIVQEREFSFAAFMLNNWGGNGNLTSLSNLPSATTACYPDCGNFTNWTISGNIIDCGDHLCDFGMQIGPQPWKNDNSFPNIYGGTITGNDVNNANQGINVDGAGTTEITGHLTGDHPVKIYDNAVSGTPGTATFQCTAIFDTTDFNLSERGSSPTGGARPYNFAIDGSNDPIDPVDPISDFCP